MPTLTLESTVYTLQQLLDVPEAQVALAGRSNVGKSSLINALAVRKKLAKVSATPGKTRSINFYRVQPHNFFLVDLPGYGYARASHSERRSWATLLEKYLSTCKNLRALALLLDSRLPPQKLDLDLAGFARSCRLPLLPILTFDHVDEAVQFINARPHPLACYLFSRDKAVQRRFLSEVPFGGGCINDTIIHLATSRMGFGGVGMSGMGSYHGKKSFDTFSHEKSIVKKSTLIDLPVRYAPYSRLKDALLRVFLR